MADSLVIDRNYRKNLEDFSSYHETALEDLFQVLTSFTLFNELTYPRFIKFVFDNSSGNIYDE